MEGFGVLVVGVATSPVNISDPVSRITIESCELLLAGAMKIRPKLDII